MAIEFRQARLSNGLTIVGECDEAAHSAAAGFFVKTGARDESPAVMGVSHFLEHMMFKGTARRDAEAINREFDELGARANAYTSNEMTCFYAATLPERLPAALDVLGDMMRPALRESDFSTERGVILEEIAMYDDDPGWVLYERAIEEHYAGHPLAHRVLGTRATIGALTAEQMRGYFERRYSSDNTTLALAGRVDFDAVVAQAEALCGSWRSTGATRDAARPATQDRSFEMRSDKVSRAYVVLMSGGPGAADPRRYAAFVLAQALGGPDNSLLHWALVEPGLAEQAEAGYDPHDGIGDFRVFIACETDDVDEAWGRALEQIDSAGRRITADDVARIRARVATGVTLAGERPEGRLHRLGRQWMYFGSYTTLEEELARIQRVTLDDVRALLTDFPLKPRTVGRLLPPA